MLILDDVLLENNKPAEFLKKTTNFAAMGRYGNTLLANGKTNYFIEAATNKILKLYVLNAANARPIKLAIENSRLKVIGSDASDYEKAFFSNYVIIAPSERAIIEVFFETPREYLILNDAPFSKEVFGKIIPAAAQIETTIGVVLLPAIPPIECLSATFLLCQESIVPVFAIASVR